MIEAKRRQTNSESEDLGGVASHARWTHPVHTTLPGRARFDVVGLRRNPIKKHFLEHRIRKIDAKIELKASEVTGSVLAQFPAHLKWVELQTLIEKLCGDYQRGEREPFHSEKDTNAKFDRQRTAVLSAVDPAPSKADPGVAWHTLTEAEVLAKLGATPTTGLSSQLAKMRLTELGPNALTHAKRRTGTEILIGQFNSLPVGLLVGSAALSVVTGGAVEAVVILAVVAANAYIGYTTESLAEKTINLLSSLGPTHILVIRDGQAQKILNEEMVPGDVFLITPGLAIPADGRLLKAEHLSIDESALTGENMPAQKRAGILNHVHSLAERVNSVFRGTVVTGW